MGNNIIRNNQSQPHFVTEIHCQSRLFIILYIEIPDRDETALFKGGRNDVTHDVMYDVM